MSLRYRSDGNALHIYLAGRIDSSNAKETLDEALALVQQNKASTVVLDCEQLEYLSSAGLRMVLQLRKAVDEVSIVDASPSVYEVFEMTGFTEMLPITKALRKLSVDGCEVIGEGANGVVYRYDPETVVKVYRNPCSLLEIKRERELARRAFILGVPTAIPYDIVRVGNLYGSVFELLEATPVSKLISSGELTVEEAADMMVGLLHQIHQTQLPTEGMVDKREDALDWARFITPHLDASLAERLLELISQIPQPNTMLHGDYHVKNVVVQNGESLIVDMDTVGFGHPVLELAGMYSAYVGYGEADGTVISDFLGIPLEAAHELWQLQLKRYLNDADEATIRAIEEKAMVISATRVIRRCIQHEEMDADLRRRLFAIHRARLETLVPRIDSLAF